MEIVNCIVVNVYLKIQKNVTEMKYSFVVQTLSSQYAVIIVSHYHIVGKFRGIRSP